MQLANYGGYFLESVDGVSQKITILKTLVALCDFGLKFSVEARRVEKLGILQIFRGFYFQVRVLKINNFSSLIAGFTSHAMPWHRIAYMYNSSIEMTQKLCV